MNEAQRITWTDILQSLSDHRLGLFAVRSFKFELDITTEGEITANASLGSSEAGKDDPVPNFKAASDIFAKRIHDLVVAIKGFSSQNDRYYLVLDSTFITDMFEPRLLRELATSNWQVSINSMSVEIPSSTHGATYRILFKKTNSRDCSNLSGAELAILEYQRSCRALTAVIDHVLYGGKQQNNWVNCQIVAREFAESHNAEIVTNALKPFLPRKPVKVLVLEDGEFISGTLEDSNVVELSEWSKEALMKHIEAELISTEVLNEPCANASDEDPNPPKIRDTFCMMANIANIERNSDGEGYQFILLP